MPETKAYLKAEFAQSGKTPGGSCVKFQRQLLERFGVTADFGVSMLNVIGQQSNPDPELMSKMQQFSMGMQTATREAMMTDEERAAFYADIPPFMHHVPYLWAVQKQQMVMNEMKNQQASLNDQLVRMMADPGAVAKVVDFAVRVKTMQDEVVREVAGWELARRSAFFADFQEDPILLEIVNSGSSLAARLNKFADMSVPDLTKMVTLAAVINEDVRARGQFLQTMAKGGVLQSVIATWSTIVRAGFKVLSESDGSVFGFGPRNQQPGVGIGDHGHGMHGGDGHVHGPNCNHSASGGTMLDHDHAGAGNEMER